MKPYRKICDHSIFTFLSLMYIRMSGKSVNFDDKKIKRRDFYKAKKYFKSIILMLLKY